MILDLENFSKLDDSKWSNPEVVLGYLEPKRIEFYHTIINELVKNGINFDNKITADFGTCTGYLLRIIANKFKPLKLYGYDYNDMFVKLATHLVPIAQITKHNILSKNDLKYDIILITEVIEHLTDPDTAIKNLTSSLNKNGKLIISIPDGRKDRFSAGEGSIDGVSFSGHINFWSIESFELYLRKFFSKDKICIINLDKSLLAIIRT